MSEKIECIELSENHMKVRIEAIKSLQLLTQSGQLDARLQMICIEHIVRLAGGGAYYAIRNLVNEPLE